MSTEQVVVPGMRLGANPSPKDPATKLMLARLDVRNFFGALPQPPQTFDATAGIALWPMYANDRYGDCTCAAAGHMLEVWTNDATGTPRIITDTQVLALYNTVNHGVDQGADPLTVMNALRQGIGIGGDHIYGFATVDTRDLHLVKTASWLFRGLYIGIEMPISAHAQTQAGRPWDVVPGPNGRPGSWGGTPSMSSGTTISM